MSDHLLSECYTQYANWQPDHLKRTIIMEAIRIATEVRAKAGPNESGLEGLIPRIVASVGCDKRLVCKTLREASQYKREQIPILLIAEEISDR